jgi:hypothetical protein
VSHCSGEAHPVSRCSKRKVLTHEVGSAIANGLKQVEKLTSRLVANSFTTDQRARIVCRQVVEQPLRVLCPHLGVGVGPGIDAHQAVAGMALVLRPHPVDRLLRSAQIVLWPRLQALPFVTTCVGCQAQIEKTNAARRRTL